MKDTYFFRNAAGVAAVEFFWGLGFPAIIESTFLQLFLKKLGASAFLIGLVPSILIMGISILPLVSSYMTRNCESKKKIVLYLHLLTSFSILFFGLFLFFAKGTDFVLPAFFIAYLIFSVSIGLTFPVWLNFLVKIFSEKKSVKGLGIMYLAQNTARVIASILILKTVQSYSFSLDSAAWIFFSSGSLFFLGSLCFFFTREPPPMGNPGHLLTKSFFHHTKDTVTEMVSNKNLMLFLIGDMDNYVIMTVVSFYANYATGFYAIADHTAAGLFVCFLYSGAIVSNFFVGTIDLMSLRQKFISTKLISLVAVLVLIFFPNFYGFLSASFLMGFCRGTRNIIYSPCIKKFCGKEDSTAFFAVAPLLTLAFGSGFPLFCGRALDRFSHLGSTAYHGVFALCILMIFLTLIFGIFVNFNPKIKNAP